MPVKDKAWQIKALAAKPGDLSSIRRTLMVEGENRLPQTVLQPPHTDNATQSKDKKPNGDVELYCESRLALQESGIVSGSLQNGLARSTLVMKWHLCAVDKAR